MTQRSMLDPQQLPHQLTAIAEQAKVFVNLESDSQKRRRSAQIEPEPDVLDDTR